jgi:hypothetical protein
MDKHACQTYQKYKLGYNQQSKCVRFEIAEYPGDFIFDKTKLTAEIMVIHMQPAIMTDVGFAVITSIGSLFIRMIFTRMIWHFMDMSLNFS